MSERIATLAAITGVIAMKNRVLVIIVTYNGMKWIDRCLGSLKDSDEAVDVFVVDNGSTDGTPARVREICRGWFRETANDGSGWWLAGLVEPGQNLGFGGANNIGLRYALENGYSYVYLLNQNAWIQHDTITALVRDFEKDGSYGILSPIQTCADGTRPDPRFEAKCGKYLPDRKSLLPGRKEVYDVPFVMAAHWMISRKCLEAVGGFSPAFHHYGEDDNYIHRCLWHGFRCGVDITVIGVHDRATRVMDKASRMRLKSIGSTVQFSNPGNLLLFRIFWQPVKLFLTGLVYFSPTTMADAFRLIGSMPKLIRYRRLSRRGSAFLG